MKNFDTYDERSKRQPLPKPDRAQILQTANLVLGLGEGCLELRVVGKKSGTWTEKQSRVGYYNDAVAFARDALEFHGKNPIYFGLNRRKNELLHALPSANSLHVSSEAGGAADILLREWLPIDIDSKRPTTKIAASQSELNAALAVRNSVAEDLRSRGIRPIPGMSGNGGHLLVRTIPYSLEKTEDGKDGRVALLLRYFNRVHGNPSAEVDVGNYDPARVWKTYGTAAVKGGNTTERPWRTATADIPNGELPEPVDVLALYDAEIREQREYEKSGQSTSQSNSSDDSEGDWRSKFTGDFKTLDIVQLSKALGLYHHPLSDGKHSIRCPQENLHTTGAPGDGSTVIFEGRDGKWPRFKCSHAHCVQFGIREFLESTGAETVDAHCKDHVRRKDKKSKNRSFEFIKLDELMSRPEEKINWLVQGMLPMGGTSIVAAKPKVGKTTLLRQLALAVARGNKFLGRNITQGAVLILSVEEKLEEVKGHFKSMGADGTEPIYIHAARAPDDALVKLKDEIERIKPVLVIVDTLFRVIRVQDSNDYAVVTTALEPLQELARESGAHILSVHHMGKAEREGGDGILGSTAILGAFDTAVVLTRKDSKRTIKTIQRYGKDLDEMTLEFNLETRMTSLGESKRDADTAEASREIFSYLSGRSEAATEKEIAKEIGGNKQRRLHAIRLLCDSGRVLRGGMGGKNDPYRYGVNPNGPTPGARGGAESYL